MTESCIMCGGSEDSMLHPDYADWVRIASIHNIICKISKNLKFKKGVGITIKSKETSIKLAI